MMNKLETAKLLLRLSEDPQPRRALQREAADLILAAAKENPGLTLTQLTMFLNNTGVWTGYDERKLEQLISWRQRDRELEREPAGV
jgi:hypothetical protein